MNVIPFFKKRKPSRSADPIRSGAADMAKVHTESIVDSYVTGAPTAQNAIDLFKGEWSSMLPEDIGVESGTAEMFGDARILQMLEALGGIKGLRVLELGPLEAAHTTMLERAGAASVTAVEANTRAYMKCLIVKELLGLTVSKFLLGDLNAYMEETAERFDLCVASGVLYHQTDPFDTLRLIAEVADVVLLWTHYYDPDVILRAPDIAAHFTADPRVRSIDGVTVHYYPRDYLQAVEWKGFCGAGVERTHWMTRQDIVACLVHVGLVQHEVLNENRDHPNGPCFTVLARKG